MTGLPEQYQWLKTSLDGNANQPAMVAEALKFYGVHEIKGPENNPVIIGWAKEIAALPGKKGVADYKSDDTTAWCGLFMSHVAHATGNAFPDEPLWALNWAAFAQASPAPALGDVLVFNRYDPKTGKLIGGHVGLYVAEDADAFHVLGGNESDQVEITRMAKSRLKASRRPSFPSGLPANVKPNVVAADGKLSTNEA